jgi:serine/threonine protein kinase
LPAEMVNCTKLELLRIAANRFETLPEWLLSMPRLSWLGYSGNPVCAAAEARALSQQVTLTQTPWASLQLKQKLGEGASGVIYQAALADTSREVAVKVFKGALTSDGLPHSEIAAYVSAGSHPYLINLLGKVTGHPEKIEALVMQLVDPSYRNLAAPPSLQSCTRDVYAADRRFNLQDVLRVAHGVASLARQLHSRGLTHGDLYAHNTLIGDDGHAVLGDFGAAAFYDQTDLVVAQALEKIEVRAFGCLFEELLERVDRDSGFTDQQHAALQAATALCDQCFLPQVLQRPLFAGIEESLLALVAASKVI